MLSLPFQKPTCRSRPNCGHAAPRPPGQNCTSARRLADSGLPQGVDLPIILPLIAARGGGANSPFVSKLLTMDDSCAAFTRPRSCGFQCLGVSMRNLLGATTAALCFSAPASAVTIRPIYDSSITSLANSAQIQSAFNTIAADYAKSFASPVTVNVGVSWGKVGNTALPSNAVGASSNNLYGYF